MFLVSFDIYLITVYHPPSSSDDDNEALSIFLENFCADKEELLQGDFNLPSLRWDLPDLLSQYILPLDLLFYNTFTSIGLTQIVKQETNFPSGNVLDLCLVAH